MNPILTAAAREQRRRLLLPIASLLAAVSIAGVSGATFSASTTNPLNSYSTGSFAMANSRNATHIFSASNLKPGDTVVGTVTITNSGSLPATVSLTEASVTNTFEDKSKLSVTVTDVTSPGSPAVLVNNRQFGTLGTVATPGVWAAGEARTYEFRVRLDSSATNAERAKAASATYDWNSLQTDGVVVDGQA